MNPTQPSRPWLQFSIREVLIAMVAVGAVAALFVKNRPYGQSSFLNKFDAAAQMKQICTDKKVPVDVGAASYGSGTVFGGGYQVEADMSLRAPTLDEFEQQVMPEWYQRVQSQLDAEGCEVLGESRGGETIPGTNKFRRVSQFGYRYRQGTAHGVLRVYALPYPEGQVRVLVLLDEH